MSKRPENVNDLFSHTRPDKGQDLVELVLADWPLFISPGELPDAGDGRVKVRSWDGGKEFDLSWNSWFPPVQHYDARMIVEEISGKSIHLRPIHAEQNVEYDEAGMRVRYEIIFSRLGKIADKHIIQNIRITPRSALDSRIESIWLERSVSKQYGLVTKGALRFSAVHAEEMYGKLGITKRLQDHDDLFLGILPGGKVLLEDIRGDILKVIKPSVVASAGMKLSLNETVDKASVAIALGTKSFYLALGKMNKPGFVKKMFGLQPEPMVDIKVSIMHVPEYLLN